MARSFAFSNALLADDLIDEGLDPLVGRLMPRSGGRAAGGSGSALGAEAAAGSAAVAAAGKLIPKFGVLVEMGRLGAVKFCGARSSLDGNEGGELKLEVGVLASGGKSFGDEEFATGIPGGVSRGAGCSDGAVELGNAIGGTAGSDPAIVAGGKGLGFGLEPKPFDGVLLNISKAFEAFPDGVDAMGLGPDTSGKVSSWPSSNSALLGVSVPFMAT